MTQPRLTVRMVAPDAIEVPATVAVLNDAFRRHAFLGNDRTSTTDLGHELHPSSRLVQIFDGHDLVGTGTVTPALHDEVDPTRFPGIDLSRALYFAMAAVPRKRMGQGIGSMILAESERWGLDQGYAHVILMTIEEMGNVAYYQRFAYETVSVHELPAGYWGLTIPTHEHAMAKALVPQAGEGMHGNG